MISDLLRNMISDLLGKDLECRTKMRSPFPLILQNHLRKERSPQIKPHPKDSSIHKSETSKIEQSSLTPNNVCDKEKQPVDVVIRNSSTFSLQKQLEKVKILFPLTKLLKQPNYKSQVSQFMCPSTIAPSHDSLILQEERPMVVFGPHVKKQDSSATPFYVTLVVHDILLHNCMFDSRASHNLMPLSIMEHLGLQTTRPYKDLYSFDSERVKCLGMIKDLVVNLAQIPTKSVVVDIVVADIHASFGMLFSRSCGL